MGVTSKESLNGDGSLNGSSKVTLNVKGKTIDLDDLGSDVPVSLHFVEAGFGMDGLEAIHDFVLKGELPNVN